MEDIFVGRLMSSPVHTVTPGTSIRNAARTMIDHDVGSVVVVDDAERLQGILTATDFVRIAASEDAETTVSAYMSTDVITATANDPIRDIADTIIERGFHHVPVVDDGDVVIGMITTTDFTAYLSRVKSPSPA